VLLVVLAYVLAWTLGNGGILAASMGARVLGGSGTAPESIPGIPHFRQVDDRVWRGGAPSGESYAALAEAGAATVVDLRAGDHTEHGAQAARAAGMAFERVPLHDGRAPTAAEVEHLLAVIAASEGPVFLHCNAGVGRTGSMTASYLVATGQEGGTAALRRSLAIGPPSLEQVAYMAQLRPGEEPDAVPDAVVAMSRAIDAPRHVWHVLRG
jgi:protein tyrosine phosphatase (PTP) superfamily phosphohydrolase (DUF442 family)